LDTRVCARPGCGNPLLPGRRLKSFCSYACRGQFKALEATGHRTGLRCSKNNKQNKALRSLKRKSVRAFTFSKTNSCTYRLDRTNKLGAGWLMEVAWPGGARQRWIARVGDRASDPLTLDEAKRVAVAMLRECGKAEPHDWIAELNRIAASEVDRVALTKLRQQWPCDLVGGSRHGSLQIDGKLLNAILEAELLAIPSQAEPLSGGGFRLEFYHDGYPKIPKCLPRRNNLKVISSVLLNEGCT
jgi:hypothetical protein